MPWLTIDLAELFFFKKNYFLYFDTYLSISYFKIFNCPPFHSFFCRPGRLEVHVEINLPDENGRLQIFQIHTTKMKESSYLSADVNLEVLGKYWIYTITHFLSESFIWMCTNYQESNFVYWHIFRSKKNYFWFILNICYFYLNEWFIVIWVRAKNLHKK